MKHSPSASLLSQSDPLYSGSNATTTRHLCHHKKELLGSHFATGRNMSKQRYLPTVCFIDYGFLTLVGL